MPGSIGDLDIVSCSNNSNSNLAGEVNVVGKLVRR